MGISPKPWIYSDSDHFCWDPGLTPELIKVFISGIEMSKSRWLPRHGSPANGYFDCYRDSPTSLYWTSAGFPYVHLSLTYAVSKLQAWSSTGETCFYCEDLVNCCRHGFTSTMKTWLSPFGGGTAYRMPSLFLWDIAELVMNSKWMDPKYECFPMSLTELAVRVARIRDGTNIMIKFDTSI